MSSTSSPLLLIGCGGSGCALAAAVKNSSPCKTRVVYADTDATTGVALSPFVLLGGDRLSGRGAGGDMVAARMAADDSANAFDEFFDGTRLAVLVACLGGGTGGGASPELLKRLSDRGIPTLVIATLPFSFEGDEHRQKAQRAAVAIEEYADALVTLSLDSLCTDAALPLHTALEHAASSAASAVSLLWRILEKPGYLKIDIESARRIISGAGRGRFAAVSGAKGPNRAGAVLEGLAGCRLLAASQSPVRTILCGILAGEDLRLSETGEIAEGVRDLFGRSAQFNLATVNDEASFGGAISAAVLLFESPGAGQPGDRKGQGARDASQPAKGRNRRGGSPGALAHSPQGRGRFSNIEPTVWNGEDLDVPTYIRRNISINI